MKTIPIVGFAAWSGTGKTTLIEQLAAQLTAAGVRVAVIKHDAHRFEIDREGKDSWRFTRAGAVQSIIASGEKTALVETRPMTLEQLSNLVHDVDFVLVEGYKAEGLTQIGISRRATGKGFPAPLSRYAAVVTDEDLAPAEVPVFALEDVPGLVRFLLDHRQDFTQIPARTWS